MSLFILLKNLKIGNTAVKENNKQENNNDNSTKKCKQKENQKKEQWPVRIKSKTREKWVQVKAKEVCSGCCQIIIDRLCFYVLFINTSNNN